MTPSTLSDASLGHGAALRHVLGNEIVIDDPEIMEAYRHDHAETVIAGRPSVVVTPSTTSDVAAILRHANSRGIPVVTRGAGSGLSGGANAVDGCIILVTTRMDKILEIDQDDQVAVVQPGVINGDLARAVAEYGMFYPPDPASRDFCTIGGNVATNAGGLCCVRYGVTSEYVLGLELALADGTVTRVGRRTVKGVAGYDLARLVTGSEGTLAVITEVTLRLIPSPPPAATMVASFKSLISAGRAVSELTRDGVSPSLLEIMDQTTLAAVESYRRMDLDLRAAALLLVQVDAQSESLRSGELVRRCQDAGADFVVVSTDADEADQLMTVRRLAYTALERQGATILDDVCVPRSRIPDLLGGIQRIAQKRGLQVGVFGHAGDGNMHPTIVYEKSNASSTAAALQCFNEITTLALELGGTVTGEHGVGALKPSYLHQELDAPAVALLRGIKTVFDPNGLLNPGKAIA